MSTRYFKHASGQKMVIDDPLNMQHCPPVGFVECDADWQPLPSNKPLDPPLVKVREWVSDHPYWRNDRWSMSGDGPVMFSTPGHDTEEMRMGTDAERMYNREVYEVHPGTRVPIDQSLPDVLASSGQFAIDPPQEWIDDKTFQIEPPAEAVREFVHHTDFRFTGDKCEASVNGGPWKPVNDTIDDMAAIGAKEVACEPPANDRAEPSQLSVDYLSGKVDAVAEAVSGLSSRVSRIEVSQDASGREWNFWRKGIEAELKRFGDETAKAFRDLADAVNRHEAEIDTIEAELHAMSDRMRKHEKHVDEQWQVLCVECDRFSTQLRKVAERLDSIESNARQTDAVVNELSAKVAVKPEPMHIQVASLIAVNQKLEADLRIAKKERDELQVRCNDMESRANDYRLCCERLKIRSDERLIDRLESLLNERDELRARVELLTRKSDVPDDSYPRTYRLGGNWYVTFETKGAAARCYNLSGEASGWWVESEMAAQRAVRCPDPRVK